MAAVRSIEIEQSRRDSRQHRAEQRRLRPRPAAGATPAWGVRDLEEVAACANENGFGVPEIVEMPGQQSLADLPAELTPHVAGADLRSSRAADGRALQGRVDSNRMFADAVEHLNRLDPHPISC